MAGELDGLRNKLNLAEDKHDDLSSQLEEMRHREADLLASKERLITEHAQELAQLRAEHQEVLKRRDLEAVSVLSRREAAHAEDLKRADVERNGVFTESQEEHAAAIALLAQRHADRLATREAELSADLEATKTEHARLLEAREADSVKLLERVRADHAVSHGRLAEEKMNEAERLKGALAKSREEHVATLQLARSQAECDAKTLQEQHAAELERVQADHATELSRTQKTHAAELERTLGMHDSVVGKTELQLAAAMTALETARMHASDLETAHAKALASVTDSHGKALTEEIDLRHGALEESTLAKEALVKDHQVSFPPYTGSRSRSHQLTRFHSQTALKAEIEQRKLIEFQHADLSDQHAGVQGELESLRTMHLTEKETFQAQVDEMATFYKSSAAEHEKEKASLEVEVAQLREQLTSARADHEKLSTAVPAQESLVRDLDRHRSSLLQVQTELFKTKHEIDVLHSERVKQDAAMRELQAKLAEYSAASSPIPETLELSSSGRDSLSAVGPRESLRDLNIARASSPINRTSKPPPPTPPPTMPPPPPPSGIPTSSSGDDLVAAAGSCNSQQLARRTPSLTSVTGRRPETPASGDGHSAATAAPDAKLVAQVEEHETTIKALNKRLQHCEADLQANIDLVNTLESALVRVPAFTCLNLC